MSNRIVLPQESTPLELPPTLTDFIIGSESSQEAPQDTPATQVPAESQEPVQSQPEAVAPSSEPVVDPAHARSFAQIAKREREQRQKEQELRELEQRLNPLREAADMLEKKDAWGLLNRMGLSYEELTKEYISGKSPDPNRAIREEIERVRQENAQEIARLREAEERRRMDEERHILRQTIDSSESYPLVRGAEAHDLVLNAIQSHYQEHGELVSYEDAAAAVETSLSQLVDRLLKIPSVRAKYVSNTSPSESPREPSREDRPVPTMSNEHTQDRVHLVSDTFDPTTASDEEMIERLASQLRYIE